MNPACKLITFLSGPTQRKLASFWISFSGKGQGVTDIPQSGEIDIPNTQHIKPNMSKYPVILCSIHNSLLRFHSFII